MANTSAAKLLDHCLSGESWTDQLLREALEEEQGRAFFRVVVERLGDMFEPRLCDEYARLFARVIEIVHPQMRANVLLARYERIRQPRVCTQDPSNVFVLSRITLGADVAVTSIVLAAAKIRFPRARIYFVGPQKNYDLFASDERIEHFPFLYPRAGSISERLASWPQLDGLVVDPDSRLSQLGLLPICNEEQYFFFESRAYGGDSDATLVQLTQQWLKATFNVDNAKPWINPRPSAVIADVVISLGIGDNPEKRIADPFEEELLRAITAAGADVLIDEGAGGDETARVRRLCAQMRGLRAWSGAYAPFAYAISKARQYIGYDSAGQHVAAASATPLISIFAGYPSERMFHRWKPDGPGPIHVIKVTERDPAKVLKETLQYGLHTRST